MFMKYKQVSVFDAEGKVFSLCLINNQDMKTYRRVEL
jgi:hypothetical protein